ncbi:MAG TPA: toll/interleukin-1 receptor domain-containing protein [Aggregatilineales bacterium]|nr:toll/interleukin-1 receptor domain-containing protein [Aggregatilineales bacterium]
MDRQFELERLMPQLCSKNHDTVLAAVGTMRERHQLEEGWLEAADLRGANLRGADLHGANLQGVNFHDANLHGATLQGANLRGALLAGISLIRADLRLADLRQADLSRADLRAADLSGADLSDANLTEALCSYTVFANLDLARVTGLDTIRHEGPSSLAIDTLFRAQGSIPDVFLRGCGVPEILIRQLPELLTTAGGYPQCFISYSHTDHEFARKLEATLQDQGIRCWRDESRLGGTITITDQLGQALQQSDKVLLCASRQSLTSGWVDDEIEIALQLERDAFRASGERRAILIVLDLDGYIHSSAYRSSKKELLRSRYCFNFTTWANEAAYRGELARLIASLREGSHALPLTSTR